jgi:polyphosphate kinase 2
VGNRDSADEDQRLEALQLAVVQTQSWLIETGARVLVILEGRDAAGKDGAIKALTANMSARRTRVVSLPKPTELERTQWYFQRYVAQLPSGGDVVIFNRSWYNRGGVEPVNGFCTAQQAAQFLDEVPGFEAMLAASGIRLVKFWLDIARDEQRRRLKKRREDPLKALKVSPLDAVADEKWDGYTAARDAMLAATSTPQAPWVTVRANDKAAARIAVQAWLVRALGCPSLSPAPQAPDPAIIATFAPHQLSDGWLER